MIARLLITLALVLIASAQIYIGALVWPGAAVWFVIAAGIGLSLARLWAPLLAAIPYPLGIGLGLLTGRYAYLGEFWEAIALVTVAVGLLGIAIGILLAHVAHARLRA